MPIFEYRCQDCQAAYEALLRRDEAPVCPHCGSRKADKQLSVFAVSSASAGASPACGGEGCDLAAQGGGCAGGACPFN
jgi:putative FmdB family regulatory protein